MPRTSIKTTLQFCTVHKVVAMKKFFNSVLHYFESMAPVVGGAFGGIFMESGLHKEDTFNFVAGCILVALYLVESIYVSNHKG